MRSTAAVLCAVGVVLAAAFVAGSNTDACCPTCSQWQGACMTRGLSGGTFKSQTECVGNCTGGCLYNPNSEWTCAFERCLPSPCIFEHGTRLGTCVEGTGWALTPNKSEGLMGVYAAVLNTSMTQIVTGAQFSVEYPILNDLSMANTRVFGNSVYWVDAPDEYTYVLKTITEGVGRYQYPFKWDKEQRFTYAASDDLLLVGTMKEQAYANNWTAYKIASGTPVSTHLVHAPSFLWWPQMVGHLAFSNYVGTMTNPETLQVASWDATDNVTAPVVHNISLPDCLYSGQTADTMDRDFHVECTDGTNVSTCTAYFVARQGEGGPGHLCQIDLGTDTVSPVISKSNYALASSTVMWFSTGVVYTVANGEKGVPPGDLLVYMFPSDTFPSGSYQWIQNMYNFELDYCFGYPYTNMHFPAPGNTGNYALVNNTLLYKTSTGSGSAWYALHMDTQHVEPVTFGWVKPNTRCGYYTYGGSCQRCLAGVDEIFSSVWPMRNGTMVFWTAVDDNDAITSGLAQLDVSATTEKHRCPGCSTTGATCVRGQCMCLAGCSGVNCTEGAPFCSQATMSCAPPSLM